MSREKKLAGVFPSNSVAIDGPPEGNPRSVGASAPRLHVLVLDEEIPYPPNAGKRIRTWNLLRRLAERHQISLLCYGYPDDPSLEAVRKAGIRVYMVSPPASFGGSHLYLRLLANLFSVYPYSVDKHYSAEFQTRVEELLVRENIDIVQCEWTPYARFSGAVKKHPLLITAHNIESQIWSRRSERSGTLVHRLFFALQALKMKRFERQALTRANVVTAVTPVDGRVMQSWGTPCVRLVENGVDLEHFTPAPEAGSPEVLFLASLDWYPNLDGLDNLLKKIMPLVLAQRPETKLQIVGRQPSRDLVEKIRDIGWAVLASDVPDVRPYLSKAAVVVVPLRIGGGSRIKILEALASGKAVVSTSIGAEGLAVVHGEHLQIADEPADFAKEILGLLASAERRQELGHSGRNLVAERYGWDRMADSLESVWFEACSFDQPSARTCVVPESSGVFVS